MTNVRMSPRTLRNLLLLLIIMLVAPRISVVASGDQDFDGIDDDVEQYLASRFLPNLHFANTDHCLGPSPQAVLFRARYLSYQGQLHQDWIGINYVVLYYSDCGFNGHTGDNESFLVEIQWDPSVNDWRFRRLSAVAHWGTNFEDQTFNGYPDIWVSQDKHGNYGSLVVCNQSVGGCDDPGQSRAIALFNAGEPVARLLNDLGTLSPLWANERVWNDPDGHFKDAGDISAQLYTNHYAYAGPPPEGQACFDDCNQQDITCQDTCGSDYECLARCSYTTQSCHNYCRYSYRWDP